jgi:hypothetical protein
MPQALAAVDVRVSREAAKYCLPNKPGKRMTAIPEGALMDRREFIAAAGSVAAAATASQTFAQMAAEEPMMRPPHYKALEGARKTWRRLAGQNQLPNSSPM